MIRLLTIIGSLLALAAHADIDLVYQGYISGTKAGRAHVRIVLSEDNYAVEGSIRTKGIWDTLSPWKADFTATGTLDAGEATFGQFEMTEQDRKKHRVITVSDGVLRQVRNGVQRPDRAAPEGVDVYSALWITTRCFEVGTINNGRRFYEVIKTAHEVDGDGVETCHYDVVNKDGDRHRGMVVVEERFGRRVPVTIELNRGMETRLELLSAEPVADRLADESSSVPSSGPGSEAPSTQPPESSGGLAARLGD